MRHTVDVVIRDGAMVSRGSAEADVPWWSFTKTVIAAAALALVREGRMALDVPLVGRPYTLRQLLQHRAGLTNYGGLPAYHEAVARREDAWPVPELLGRADADRLIYPPGEGWAYSNIGYFFIRRLIEETTGEALEAALSRLVLRPLDIEGLRIAVRRQDLADVQMGEAEGYDPAWVYHGLLVGPLIKAALLLDRLMTSQFLADALKSMMLGRHPVGGPIDGRPWTSPGYGLGLMTGGVSGGATIAGHTGGGPGSVIAVYHRLSSPSPPCTAAAFSLGEDQGLVERQCVLSLTGWPDTEKK